VEYIPYMRDEYGSPAREMFPLCKECFQKLSKSEIRMYCNLLMNRWEKIGYRVNRVKAFEVIDQYLDEKKKP